MKLKKLISLSTFALCITALSGCAAPQKTPLGDYWNENALVFETIHETLVYDVTFQKGASYGYDLAYTNGTYTTILKSGVNENGDNLYIYNTELSLDVTYTLGDQSVVLHDYVTTEVMFLPAKNGLLPLSSKKSIVSHSPLISKPVKLEDCYATFEYQIETTYTENGGETKIFTEQAENRHSFTFPNANYYHLDNEQLLLALRAIPSSVSSTRFLSYSPFAKNVQNIAVVYGATAEGEFEFKKNGSAEKIKETISHRSVQIQLDEKDTGFAQKALIATTTDSYANKNRNVLLRLETPLYQAIGTFIYQLSSVNYQ